jgi:hypothetical protein
MCGGGTKPPEPTAPPAPIPVRDSQIDATRERQVASRRASSSGYSATMLTGAGGVDDATPTTAPVLGG